MPKINGLPIIAMDSMATDKAEVAAIADRILERRNKMTSSIEIYLDLDGVFADFEGGVMKATGRLPKDMPTNELWKNIHRQKSFFLDLERMEEGILLWKHIEDELHHKLGLKVTFLTGAPSSHAFREQKKQWVAKHKGEKYECIVLPKKDKQLYSGHWKVLIDDTLVNIEQWRDKGGYGLHYQGQAAPIIEQLTEIINLENEENV